MSSHDKTPSDPETALPDLAGGTLRADLADETYQIIEQHGSAVGELTDGVLKTLKRKLYIHVLTLLIFINAMLFVSNSRPWHQTRPDAPVLA
jgi:hypothetical protein